MEDKALFGRLMDMGAAHYNSYEETLAFYDVVQDMTTNIIIHDKAVYDSGEAEQAKKNICFFAKQFSQEYDELFAVSVGKELKKTGLPDMNDPEGVLHRETIVSIVAGYGSFLRERKITSDDSYKEKIWNILHKDPKGLRVV